MNLIKSTKDHYLFQLAPREKDLFLQVLALYPQVPAGYQSLSKATGPEDANQRLLDEALQETRAQSKKQLQALLSDPKKLSQTQTGWRLTLSAAEVDWLLQVLNDIRVGSWIHLGSPETPLQTLTEENAPRYWALEMAGFFQGRFLELLEGS